MKRPGGTRRVLKWGGVVLSVIIAGAWTTSLWWGWGFDTRTRDVFIRSGVAVVRGALEISYGRDMSSMYDSAMPPDIDFFFSRDPGQRVEMRWLPSAGSALIFGGRSFVLPLWIPLLLVTIPTAVLWWRDRRFPLGHCQRCGYDLTGNTSGTCPQQGPKP